MTAIGTININRAVSYILLDNVSETNPDRHEMPCQIFQEPHFLLLHRRPTKRRREENNSHH